MDRYTFLAGRPFLISLPSSQWPPAVANTTSEIIFRFCCFQDCEENYLFFRPAPIRSGPVGSRLNSASSSQSSSSSDTTTDGNELQRATQNALHVCTIGGAIHYAAILQIEVDSDDTALPPSFTMCFEDVNMKFYGHQGPTRAPAAAEGVARQWIAWFAGFRAKAARSSDRRAPGQRQTEGGHVMAEKTQAWRDWSTRWGRA